LTQGFIIYLSKNKIIKKKLYIPIGYLLKLRQFQI
jgi:hypothetical protein